MIRICHKVLSVAVILLSAVSTEAQEASKGLDLSVSYPMESVNAEWMRDVYREVDLSRWKNSGLFCPMEHDVRQRGLFTRLLTLAAEKAIPVYRYAIDGNEQFDSQSLADIRDVLSSHYIPYTEKDGKAVIKDADIPASEVMKYYIREAVYYDLTNSSFRTSVSAICPILIQEDEFGEGKIQYPLFWVKYSDLEPYLRDLPIIPDYRNVSDIIPMSDYFTLGRYEGSIYKVSNAFGHTLAQYCETDSLLSTEQARLEKEMEGVKDNTYSVFPEPETAEDAGSAEKRGNDRRASEKKDDFSDSGMENQQPRAAGKRSARAGDVHPEVTGKKRWNPLRWFSRKKASAYRQDGTEEAGSPASSPEDKQ